MKIINRYLLKELAGPFLGALFVSTFILAAGNVVQSADMIINRGVNPVHVVLIFLYLMPYVMIFTLPISVLAAVLLGFGRLSGDNEFTALRTSGVSIRSLVVPALVCGFLISLASIPLNDKVLPNAKFRARKLIHKAGMQSPTAMIEPGVFIKGFQDYIVFIHSVQGEMLEDVRIYQPREEGSTRTIIARQGRIIPLPEEDSVRLHLIDGIADEIAPHRPDEFYKLSFEDYYMTLSLGSTTDVSKINKKASEKSIAELLQEIESISERDVDATPLKIELHQKIALSFSNFIFVLIGIPLAITTHRREKFIGFAMAMLLFLVYWGFIMAGIAFAVKGILPVWIGVWGANIVLFIPGVIFIWKLAQR